MIGPEIETQVWRHYRWVPVNPNIPSQVKRKWFWQILNSAGSLTHERYKFNFQKTLNWQWFRFIQVRINRHGTHLYFGLHRGDWKRARSSPKRCVFDPEWLIQLARLWHLKNSVWEDRSGVRWPKEVNLGQISKFLRAFANNLSNREPTEFEIAPRRLAQEAIPQIL